MGRASCVGQCVSIHHVALPREQGKGTGWGRCGVWGNRQVGRGLVTGDQAWYRTKVQVGLCWHGAGPMVGSVITNAQAGCPAFSAAPLRHMPIVRHCDAEAVTPICHTPSLFHVRLLPVSSLPLLFATSRLPPPPMLAFLSSREKRRGSQACCVCV